MPDILTGELTISEMDAHLVGDVNHGAPEVTNQGDLPVINQVEHEKLTLPDYVGNGNNIDSSHTKQVNVELHATTTGLTEAVNHADRTSHANPWNGEFHNGAPTNLSGTSKHTSQINDVSLAGVQKTDVVPYSSFFPHDFMARPKHADFVQHFEQSSLQKQRPRSFTEPFGTVVPNKSLTRGCSCTPTGHKIPVISASVMTSFGNNPVSGSTSIPLNTSSNHTHFSPSDLVPCHSGSPRQIKHSSATSSGLVKANRLNTLTKRVVIADPQELQASVARQNSQDQAFGNPSPVNLQYSPSGCNHVAYQHLTKALEQPGYQRVPSHTIFSPQSLMNLSNQVVQFNHLNQTGLFYASGKLVSSDNSMASDCCNSMKHGCKVNEVKLNNHLPNLETVSASLNCSSAHCSQLLSSHHIHSNLIDCVVPSRMVNFSSHVAQNQSVNIKNHFASTSLFRPLDSTLPSAGSAPVAPLSCSDPVHSDNSTTIGNPVGSLTDIGSSPICCSAFTNVVTHGNPLNQFTTNYADQSEILEPTFLKHSSSSIHSLSSFVPSFHQMTHAATHSMSHCDSNPSLNLDNQGMSPKNMEMLDDVFDPENDTNDVTGCLVNKDRYPERGMKFTVHRTYDSVPHGDTDEGLPGTLEEEPEPLVKRPSRSPDDSLGFYDTEDLRPNGSSIAHRGRLYAQRQTRRLVFKDGEVNIALGHIRERRRRYIGDIFTTMLDIRWRYVLIAFGLAFVISWLLFALLWWIIMVSHGDNKHKDDPNWQACVANVYDFVTALLFSIETQHTIGYGYRMMESKCPEAILLLMIQSCLGVFIQSLMTGIIFAKLARPKRRADTMMFSKQAVICQRDSEYCLLFRVADMRRSSYIVNTTIRAVLVQNRITKEGELLPLGQVPLEVQAENAVDYYIFLPWPTTIIHRINSDSPLYDLSAEQLVTARFEIIVYLEGTVESTGMTAQVRTSYLPSECLWGHRLAPLVTYQKDDGQYRVDFTQFHATIPCDMPECSAREYAECGGSAAGTPPPSLSHHLSYANNLPGLSNPSRRGYRRDDADNGVPDNHGFTIGPERPNSTDIKKYSKGRINKGLKRGRLRHRGSAKWLFGRLNGLIKTTSLDDIQMRSSDCKRDKSEMMGETTT